jgi:RNA polymerase sigma-70 factor (ECF subfamily)
MPCVTATDHGTDELRARLRKQPDAVLAVEFGRYRNRLWKMISFRLDPRLAGRIEPDDVLQEAWLAAVQRVPHFLEHETLTMFVWLRMIVGQTIIDMHRHHLGARMRDAYREVSFNNAALAQSTSVSIAARLLASVSSPSQAAIRSELAEQLHTALEAMDPIDREVLALRHFEELTNSEVAEVLGIQQKAASIRYVRAVKRLGKILEQLPEFRRESADG